jgi:hypothetical protein
LADAVTFSETLGRGAQAFQGRTGADSLRFSEALTTSSSSITTNVLLIALTDRSRITLHVNTSARTATMASDTLSPGTQATDSPRVTLKVTTSSRTALAVKDEPA